MQLPLVTLCSYFLSPQSQWSVCSNNHFLQGLATTLQLLMPLQYTAKLSFWLIVLNKDLQTNNNYVRMLIKLFYCIIIIIIVKSGFSGVKKCL